MATPESVKAKIKDLFEDHFADYLSDVEDDHTDDPITLPDFKEYHVLDSTAYRFVTARQFPALFILDGAMLEVPSKGARVHSWDLEVVLVMELRHQSPETLSKLKSRYREAMWDLLTAYQSLDGVAFGPCRNFRWGRSGTVPLKEGSIFQQSTPLVFTAKISQL